MKLAIMQEGNLFAEDDVMHERPHFGSVKCISGNGFLYLIKTHEFLRKFQEVPESWRNIARQVAHKDKIFLERLVKIDKVFSITAQDVIAAEN